MLDSLQGIFGAGSLLGDKAHRLTDEQASALRSSIAEAVELASWMVRAAAAWSGHAGTEAVDAGLIVGEAASFAHVDLLLLADPIWIRGNADDLRIAFEALLLALTDDERAPVISVGERTIQMIGATQDLSFDTRRWKIELAERILERHGAALRIESSGTTRARITFPRPAETDERQRINSRAASWIEPESDG